MIKEAIRRYATETLGFDEARVTSPFLNEELDTYREAVRNREFGDMEYLERHLPFKEDPNLLLPGVKSAVVVIKNYKNTIEKRLNGDRKVARYAAGLDYHQLMSARLWRLSEYMKTILPEVNCYVGVDSRPIPERSLAIKAGIGFRGRNSMVIRPKLGSYFLIGVVLTTADLEPDGMFKGGCGTCRLCVDACPTAAISPDGKFSMTSCISYQTIEKKTPMSPDVLSKAEGWIFGCDICQEVCPFNHERVPFTDWSELMPEAGVGHRLPESEVRIPKKSALYRSKRRLLANIDTYNGLS